MCLTAELGEDDIERLAGIVLQPKPVHVVDHLFRVGDPLTSIYSVRAGSFKTYYVDKQGREHVTGFHLAGELLGLEAIYSQHHPNNAVALETSSICVLPYAELAALAGEIGGLRKQFFRLMSHHIALISTLAADSSAEERLAHFLSDLSERWQARGYAAQEFNLSMTRHDIGSHLRLATETVSRILGRFQEIGVIAVQHRRLRLLNLPALRRRAGLDP